MNDLIKHLDIFLTDYLIPTLISFVLMMIINLLLPENYWMIDKVGLLGFRLLVFVICFLGIEFVIWLRGFLFKRNEIKEYKYSKKKVETKKFKEEVEKYRRLADELKSGHRELIIKFIKTNNNPIAYARWLNCGIPSSYYWESLFCKTTDNKNREIFKLTEHSYEMYLYIYKKYGKIGNF